MSLGAKPQIKIKMQELHFPTHALFFAGVLYRQDIYSLQQLRQLVEPAFPLGKLRPSAPGSFQNMTGHYTSEMVGDDFTNDHLGHFFYVSSRPCARDDFAALKIWAMGFEDEHSHQGRRHINLDVGMLSLENMQLATHKPFAHRIYLGHGVYSDLTYIFSAGKFQFLPWTYPNYKNPEVVEFFQDVRNGLRSSLSTRT